MKKPFRVAVIDDDKLSRTLLTQIMEKDYEVLPYVSGDAFMQEKPLVDVVLLDIKMAGMNGYDVCKLFRMEERNELVPVIFISGHDAPEERLLAFESGGDDFIIKPIVSDEVRHKVQSLLTQETRIRELLSESDMARQMAFSAMTSMGDLGVILEFMRGSAADMDYRTLADRLCTALNAWNLKGTVLVRGEAGQFQLSTDSEQAPLQGSVMDALKGMGRIFQMSSRGIINYPHVSILVKNLPSDDPDKVGRLRDLLAMLGESADARVQGIDMATQAERARTGAKLALGELQRLLGALSDRMRKNQGTVSLHMQDLLSDVFNSLKSMNVTPVQEAMIADLMTEGTDSLLGLFDDSISIVEADFTKVLSLLEKLGKASPV